MEGKIGVRRQDCMEYRQRKPPTGDYIFIKTVWSTDKESHPRVTIFSSGLYGVQTKKATHG